MKYKNTPYKPPDSKALGLSAEDPLLSTSECLPCGGYEGVFGSMEIE